MLLFLSLLLILQPGALFFPVFYLKFCSRIKELKEPPTIVVPKVKMLMLDIGTCLEIHFRQLSA
jgi:hypothetical protein